MNSDIIFTVLMIGGLISLSVAIPMLVVGVIKLFNEKDDE